MSNAQLITTHEQEPTPLALIARMVEAGQLTQESVSVVKELVSLKEHMEDRQAERDFAAAFVDLQAELGSFKATKAVPDKQGNTRYTYAPYEQIMAVVQPLLRKFGFSISFSTDISEGRVVQTCTLQHQSGHHREFKSYVRTGSGPYGASETQADGAAMTYGKRYALCNALNITIEHDRDAPHENPPPAPTAPRADTRQTRSKFAITEQQATELFKAWCVANPIDETGLEPKKLAEKKSIAFRGWVQSLVNRQFNIRILNDWTLEEFDKCRVALGMPTVAEEAKLT